MIFMKQNRGKVIAALLLTSILLFTGCGDKKNDYSVDYPSDEVSENETESASSEAKSTEASDDEKKKAESDSYYADIKRGGSYSFKSESVAQGGKIKFDLEYEPVEEIDRVPTYKINMIDSSYVKEDDIVKGFFGESATPLRDLDMIQFTYENDNYDIVYDRLVNVVSNNSFGDSFLDLNTLDSWIDSDYFYAHTYEGVYNDITCRLLIAYSYNVNELYLALYPKNIGDVSGNESLTGVEISNSDGTVIIGDFEASRMFNLNENLTDKPNKCTLTDDNIVQVIKDTFQKINIDVSADEISLYGNTFNNYNIVSAENVNTGKCECIFYNNDTIKFNTLDGAERWGYVVSIKNTINGVPIKNINKSTIDYSNSDKNKVYVDNSGVFGFDLTISYSIGETVYDDTMMLDFDDAMKAAEEQIQEYMYSDLKTLNVDSVELQYYPAVDEKDTKKGELVPAWVFNTSHGYYAISAIDGSFVGTDLWMYQY
jgi:Uncharacterized conserved protein